MAKAKLETEQTQRLASTGTASGPVSENTTATDGAQPDKGLPASEDSAATEVVGENSTAAHVEGTSQKGGFATSGPEVVMPSPEVGSINDAALNDAMKRFLSQGKTVVVKGPLQGRWRAGRHFTMEPTSIPLPDLTEAELEKLCADPLLTVAVIDAPY